MYKYISAKTMQFTNFNKLASQASLMLALILAVLGVSYLFGIDPVHALSQSDLISGNDEIIQTSAGGSLRDYVVGFLNIILTFLGLIAVGYCMYGGFMVLTSNGEGIDKGKKTITYAAVGLIIIVISYAVVNTVLSVATLQGNGSTTTTQ